MPCQIARIHEIVNWKLVPRIRDDSSSPFQVPLPSRLPLLSLSFSPFPHLPSLPLPSPPPLLLPLPSTPSPRPISSLSLFSSPLNHHLLPSLLSFSSPLPSSPHTTSLPPPSLHSFTLLHSLRQHRITVPDNTTRAIVAALREMRGHRARGAVEGALQCVDTHPLRIKRTSGTKGMD